MEFRILGPLEVSDDGRPIALGGAKQRALLALLLLHANRVVPRDRLIDELWETHPPETARTALQVHVSQLRKALGRDRIVTQAPGYLVRVEPGELDLDRFERVLHDRAPDAEALREALALWRGPPLAGFRGTFVGAERARLEEQRLLVLERRIDADLALGLHASLVPELDGLVREHPLREGLRAQLMLALYRCGRQADALEAFQQGRRHLADELGLEPGERLRHLQKAILEQDTSLVPTLLPPTEPAPAPRPARPLPAPGRRKRTALIAVTAGGLILAAAIAALAVALTRGSSPVPVLPNSVAVLDPSTGKVEADIPIGGRPVSLATGAGAVWVANGDEQTILRIDRESKRITRRIGGLGSNLSGVAFGYGFLWVAGGNDGTLTRIDPRHNGTREVELGGTGAATTLPVFLVATGGGSVWTVRGNELLRIDPTSSEVTARAPVFRAEGLGAGRDAAWVVSQNEHIVRIDARTGQVGPDADLADPGFFPVVAEGSLWLIIGSEPPLVRRLDPGTLAEQASIRLPRQLPFGLASGEGALWTADHDHGWLWRIDPRTNRAARVADLPYFPIALAVDKGAVWVGVQQRRIQ